MKQATLTTPPPDFDGSLAGYCREEFCIRHPDERCTICIRKDGSVTAYNRKHTMRFDQEGREL